MAFGSFNETGQAQPMAEINTTPLVDVMLVLLVIFIITAPLFNQAVPVDLPKVEARALDEQPLVLRVSIDAAGALLIDNTPVAATALAERFSAAVAAGRPPELHLRADRGTRYERVTEVLAEAQKAGIAKIAFVTDPQR